MKRVLDITGAAMALVLFLPLMALTALAVRFRLGPPILFRQQRPGYRKLPFTIYKFRTMRDAVDSRGLPLPDGQRLDPLGTFLRRTSLDELPELWNVLRGEMSLVGPRPLLTQYLPFYKDEERVRFTVRPGITGWAQVNGRNDAAWDDRLQKDIWYVKNRTLFLDLKILWSTVAKVLRREHVVADAHATMLNLDEERATWMGWAR